MKVHIPGFIGTVSKQCHTMMPQCVNFIEANM